MFGYSVKLIVLQRERAQQSMMVIEEKLFNLGPVCFVIQVLCMGQNIASRICFFSYFLSSNVGSFTYSSFDCMILL